MNIKYMKLCLIFPSFILRPLTQWPTMNTNIQIKNESQHEHQAQGFQEGLSRRGVDGGGFHQDLHSGEKFSSKLNKKLCHQKFCRYIALRACKFRLVDSPT